MCSMFDTHCHLNFSAFKKNIDQVIDCAKKAGVENILVPGTDIKSSQRAIEIAQNNQGVFAAVGIHPHHIFKVHNNELIQDVRFSSLSKLDALNILLIELSSLLLSKKVVAIGEVGLDKHFYKSTKYKDYKIDSGFIELQKIAFEKQINLAIKYDKSLVVHNWEAKDDMLKILINSWDNKMEKKVVFHCCEPDEDLMNFAKERKIYIGVDGDVTYDLQKQNFVKKIPVELLVLETDSPYLLPEPLRSQKLYPNEPKNIPIIADSIGKLLEMSHDRIGQITTNNARQLFKIR